MSVLSFAGEVIRVGQSSQELLVALSSGRVEQRRIVIGPQELILGLPREARA